jgi:hypothetical protein
MSGLNRDMGVHVHVVRDDVLRDARMRVHMHVCAEGYVGQTLNRGIRTLSKHLNRTLNKYRHYVLYWVM